MTTLKRVDPMSAFKVMALMYLIIGIVVAVIYACIAVTSFSAFSTMINSLESSTGNTIPIDFSGFGIVGVLLMSVCGVFFYAVIGGIMGAVIAFVYNITVQWTGGLVVELESEKAKNEPVV